MLFETNTSVNIPKLYPVHGIFCTNCGSMYPEDGSIDGAMQLGCDCCGSLSHFRNVYDWDGMNFEIKSKNSIKNNGDRMFRSKNTKREEIEAEFRYMFRTPQGWEIVKHGMTYHGMLVVIAKRKRADGYDYPVAIEYSARTGNWARGVYPKTLKEAKEIFMNNVKYPDFDPFNEKDLDFQRYGRFNWNCTSSGYLERNDYRDPGFDTYGAYTRGELSREEWEKVRRQHVIDNPSRRRR